MKALIAQLSSEDVPPNYGWKHGYMVLFFNPDRHDSEPLNEKAMPGVLKAQDAGAGSTSSAKEEQTKNYQLIRLGAISDSLNVERGTPHPLSFLSCVLI